MSIERMKALMGMNESKANNKSSHLTNITEAKDGNTYAIVKENSEYFIKVLVKEGDSENISDYKYIGGEQNKRNFVYESHAIATKQLSNKVGLIAETYKKSQPVIVESVKKEATLVKESEDKSDCKCGGECKCGKEETSDFIEEEIFEGYNGKKSFETATSRNIVEMLTAVTNDWGKDSDQAKAIKEFAIKNVDTTNLNAVLGEAELHKYNSLLSEMGFIEYAGNAIMEAVEALEEEKYKLKIDAPTEKEDDGEDFGDNDELGAEDFDFGDEEGEEEVSDEKPFDDTPFDAGVEADEESDPKKFIQQLAGKLGQSIREYNSSLETPDFDLEKFAINSVISATNTAEMSEEDQDDIISKIKSSGEGDVNGEVSGEEEIESDVFDGENSDIEEGIGEGVDDIEMLGQDSEEAVEIDAEDSVEHPDAEADAEMIEDILSDELLDVIVAKVIEELGEESNEEESIEEVEDPIKKALKLK